MIEIPSETLSLSSSRTTGIRISPLRLSSQWPKPQKQIELLCRLDRGAPQAEPQNVQENAVPPSRGTTALFEDSLQFGGVFLRSATGSWQVRRRL